MYDASTAPKVGFVSLGAPKALNDSEHILTQLSAEGYQTSKSFAGADLVIVNTCRLIDDTLKESLGTTGDARSENAKFIGTGCLGARTAAKGATETETAQAGLMGENPYFILRYAVFC